MATGRPLAGATVVVTRPREQAAALAEPLQGLGAEVLLVPTIRIVPRPLDECARDLVSRLQSFALVVFTSANGVRAFCGYLDELGGGPAGQAAFAGVSVAAVGPATKAALEQRGVPCDVLADEAVAEGLVRAVEASGVAPAGARVLIPQAGEARDVLAAALRAGGALVDVLPVYDTLPAARLPVPPERIEGADFITFASGSAVRRFAALMEEAAGVAGAGEPLAERLAGARLCSIGPLTSQALRDLGLLVAVEAAEHTAAGLVAAIVAVS